jgi:glycerol-3-phosphate O-acyltransferase
MGINGPPSQTTVETALSFLSHFIDKKRNIFEPQVSSNKKITSVMMLAYYRNGLTHCFLKEAFIVVSLLGFRNYKDGAVSVEEVREKCNFLRLMKNEFMIDDQLRTDQSFNTTLAFLQ